MLSALMAATALACPALPLEGHWQAKHEGVDAISEIRLMGEDASDPRGFWIQPGNDYGGQSLATVMEFATNPGNAVSTPHPLKRDFTINIEIFCRNGEPTAWIENPEGNRVGPSRTYSLRQADDAVGLFASADAAEPAFVLRGDGPDYLLDFRQFRNLRVSRKPNDPPGPAAYAVPEADAVLPVAEATELGFDRAALDALTAELHRPVDRDRPRLIHSVLVARGGKLVFEEYLRGYSRQVPHDTRSAGKTFSSLVAGALIAQGFDLSEDTLVADHIQMSGGDQARRITLGDLLTHRSGLACDDADASSPGQEDVLWSMAGQRDFREYTASLPMVREPGTIHAYCSAGMDLSGAVYASVAGRSVLEIMEYDIARPLGFENAYWNVVPGGDLYLGGGAFLRPIDMLKLGILALQDGLWDGQRIMSEQWHRKATSPIVPITPATTGLSQEEFNNFYFGGTDGYAWHRHTIRTPDGRSFESYEAGGNGGQQIIVVPSLEMTVVFTGGNYGQGFIWGRWRDEIIGRYLIPALGR